MNPIQLRQFHRLNRPPLIKITLLLLLHLILPLKITSPLRHIPLLLRIILRLPWLISPKNLILQRLYKQPLTLLKSFSPFTSNILLRMQVLLFQFIPPLTILHICKNQPTPILTTRIDLPRQTLNYLQPILYPLIVQFVALQESEDFLAFEVAVRVLHEHVGFFAERHGVVLGEDRFFVDVVLHAIDRINCNIRCIGWRQMRLFWLRWYLIGLLLCYIL